MRDKTNHVRWLQVLPLMGVEARKYFRASMVLRYSTESMPTVPSGFCRRDQFLPPDGVPLLLPKQVHGCEILRADIERCLPLRPSCDGILLDQAGIRVALRFADCFPVLLWGVDPEPWMLGLHSGFKGTLGNISGQGARLLKERFGRDSLSSCRAWIGPGICAGCYSRGPQDPFAAEVKAVFPRDCWTECSDGVHPDLGKTIAAQLSDAGILAGNITRSPICSSCDHSICYSFRRGDILSRMWLFFEIRDFSQIGQKKGR